MKTLLTKNSEKSLKVINIHLTLLGLITFLLGGAMVSNFSYYSFKDISPSERVPFYALLAIVIGFILASLDTPKFFFALFAVYALSGPVTHLIRLRRKRQQRLLAESQSQDLSREVDKE